MLPVFKHKGRNITLRCDLEILRHLDAKRAFVLYCFSNVMDRCSVVEEEKASRRYGLQPLHSVDWTLLQGYWK